MKTSTNGIKFIKNEEGVRLYVYDYGYGNLTTGYGHKVLASDKLKKGDKITQAQSDKFFASDIIFYLSSIFFSSKYVASILKISLSLFTIKKLRGGESSSPLEIVIDFITSLGFKPQFSFDLSILL